ncbi:MAG: DNA gyrase subunit A [Legionellales bacterium]|nr:DNA gyrase subunit A [Legionellales bacterium]
MAIDIKQINIEQELKQSYLDYAMSVIIGRALPDVRDGLKPVHRRVLFAMSELNNDWNKPHKKSARVVGEVIGKYHPHSDTAVYDTIVRMAQPFTMRYLLVDGQGNFGSVDGDSPAAMRYTEVRMSRLAHSLLSDLEKETVDFQPNYDGSEFAPIVFPTRIPNLLVNGSSGIAVGMATNVPPHNLGEVINACVALIEKPDLDIQALLEYIPGPDFPTAGIINGRAGIVEAYRTGRGRIYVRARAEIETHDNHRQAIIVTELPYQVNKARLIEKIAELVKEKRIEGISGLRDESDREGMRIVIEIRRGENAEVILNNLYSQTQLQNVFGINMVALDNGQPKTMNLKHILEAFISHRREVVTRRTIFDLRKARERAHILEGLGIALVNIDEIIQLIKQSANPQEAKAKLINQAWAAGMVAEMLARASSDACRLEHLDPHYGLHNNLYHLSPDQAQAILDLRLHRLTGLEQDKIIEEYKTILDTIMELLTILANPDKLMAVIKQELLDIKNEFADERRTEIMGGHQDLTTEDLINDEQMVVTLSHLGYAKITPLDVYSAQKRGGKGKIAAKVKDEDFVQNMLIASTHDTILCFSSLGKLYWLKVYQIPQADRNARGKPIVNLIPLQANERISAMLALNHAEEGKFVVMATSQGTIKKVALSEFSRPRPSGLIAIDLHEGEELVGVDFTDGQSEIMLFSNAGKAVRFNEDTVRAMGRTAHGVRGMKLSPSQRVISLIVTKEGGSILTATQRGYGKRTVLDEYRISGRGGQGVISIQTSERNGEVVSAIQVFPGMEVLLISDHGTMVRTRVDEISQVGRNTQGVRLVNLQESETLVEVKLVEDMPDNPDETAVDHQDNETE